MTETGQRSKSGDDARLVRRVQRGDAEAWSALVDHYSGYVYALLRSTRVPDADQADAFQHVFVELFKALPTLKNTDNLAPWIRQTTLRHAIKLREKASRAPAAIDDFTFLASHTDVAAEVELADRAHTVREMVMQLPDKCRQLVWRLFFERPPRPYAEVAEALGLKATSIVMTRQRCLDLLEKSLRARGIS